MSTKRASRARIAAAGGPRVTCGRSGSYRSGPGVLIDTDTTMFVGIGACSGGIRSCGWFSRISSPPWQSPSGLHQDQSSCDAAGCAIGSRSAARAPHRTYSQQAPSLPRPMACAEAVRAAMSSPLTSSAPSCMWCVHVVHARAPHRAYSRQAPSLPRPMACAEAVRAAMSSPLTSSALGVCLS